MLLSAVAKEGEPATPKMRLEAWERRRLAGETPALPGRRGEQAQFVGILVLCGAPSGLTSVATILERLAVLGGDAY